MEKRINKHSYENLYSLPVYFTSEEIDILEEGILLEGLDPNNKTEFIQRAIRFYHQEIFEDHNKNKAEQAKIYSENDDKRMSDERIYGNILKDVKKKQNKDIIRADSIDNTLSNWKISKVNIPEGYPVYARILKIAYYIDTIALKLRAEPYNLSLNEQRILLSLLRNKGKELTPSSLKDSLLVSPGAITRQIDSMIKKGLVDREADSEDRRKILISLTDKGRLLIERNLTETKGDFLDELPQFFSEDEKNILQNLLRQLLNVFDEFVTEHIAEKHIES